MHLKYMSNNLLSISKKLSHRNVAMFSYCCLVCKLCNYTVIIFNVQKIILVAHAHFARLFGVEQV